jgi:hypothetical protein
MYDLRIKDVNWSYYDDIHKQNPILFNHLIYELYLHFKYTNQL